MRVVDVVDQLLDVGGGVGGLAALAVVGDDGAGRSADDDGALLALFGISIDFPSLCIFVWLKQSLPSCRTDCGDRP